MNDSELRGVNGDCKLTAAELSQMSFRQSVGCGDTHISYMTGSSDDCGS